MQKTFDNKNLKVIWLGFQDKESRIKEFISKHSIQDGVGYDNGDAIAKRYAIKYGAGLVIVDGDGVVKSRVARGFSEKKLVEVLKKALACTNETRKSK